MINQSYSTLVCTGHSYFYDYADTFKNIYPDDYQYIVDLIGDKAMLTVAYLINEEYDADA